jgi:hypothetical protein
LPSKLEKSAFKIAIVLINFVFTTKISKTNVVLFFWQFTFGVCGVGKYREACALKCGRVTRPNAHYHYGKLHFYQGPLSVGLVKLARRVAPPCVYNNFNSRAQ